MFTFDFAQVLQDSVLRPDLTSAFYILLVSSVNELFSLVPYSAILSGQLLFIEGPLNLAVVIKLLLFVAVPVGVGTTIGSLFLYGVAYLGGKPAIEKYGKYLRISWPSVEKMETKLRGTWYDDIVFLGLRSIPFLPSVPVNIAAGVVRMPFFSYVMLTAVGSILRLMLMFLIVGIGVETLAQ